MKSLSWLLFGVLAVVGCAGKSESQTEREDPQTLRVGSQKLQLLRGDAPIEQVRQQFKLATPREMSNGIIQLATMRDRPEVIALLEGGWRLDKSSYPDFNWPVLETPTARLAIAAVLGQGAVDKMPYRAFAQSHLESSDAMTRMDAVIALGTIGDSADLLKLAEYANGTDELLAMAALGTLHSWRTKEAHAIVEAVANNPSMSSERRNQAARMLAKSQQSQAPN